MMNRKRLSFYIAIPALLLLFFFKLLPALYSLFISFTRYSFQKGLGGSQWIGLDNYSAIMSYLGKNITHSLLLNVLASLLIGLLAFVLILCISKIPGRLGKMIAILLITLPAFIPAASFADVMVRAFYPDTGFINKWLISLGREPLSLSVLASLYPWLFAVTDSLRSLYIPVIIGVLACGKKKQIELGMVFFVLMGYWAARATTLLSPDYENFTLIYQSFPFGNQNVLDLYHPKNGIFPYTFGERTAEWIIKVVIQLIINIGVYFAFTYLAPKLKDVDDTLSNKSSARLPTFMGMTGYLILASGSIAVTACALIPQGNVLRGIGMIVAYEAFWEPIVNSLIGCVIGCVIYGFFTLTLSYPLLANTRVYPLLLFLLSGFTYNFVGEYLYYSRIGMKTTALPVILSTSISIIGAFGLHFSVAGRFRNRDMPGFGAYVKEAKRPLITLVILYFIINWGSFTYQMLYSQRGMGFVGMAFAGTRRFTLTGNMEFERPAFFFILSLVPTLLGILLIGIEKHLPLTTFVSQVRKD